MPDEPTPYEPLAEEAHEQRERAEREAAPAADRAQRERVRKLIDAVTVHRTHDGRSDDDYLGEVPPHH
jgi:hypothetical protein